MAIIDFYDIPMNHVTLVGCGHVGKGLVPMLLEKADTVTIVTKGTSSPALLTYRADLVISCCGQPQMIKEYWIKDGANVIDVGFNRIVDSSRKSGYRVVGDVDFDAVSVRANANKLTVGPVTIIMLLKQLVESHKNSCLI
jgi:methylenetetrahydrofolate dehydrogenase (NADP+)/methenyltetrahydrofolate cyclohydrolase